MSKDTGPFSSWKKPDWDDCFMGIAYMIAMMSPDHNTKHGAVLVGRHKRIVSLGFNGYPPDCLDDEMPKDRPDKYDVTEHAEANCLNQAHCDTGGMTLYVTGYPCMKCFRTIACRRIARIVYDPTIESACFSEHDMQMIELMNRKGLATQGAELEGFGTTFDYKIKFVPFRGRFDDCMNKAKRYYKIKQNLRTKKDA